MARTMTEKLIVALNASRGKVYPDIGYLMFADIRGMGDNRKSVWFVCNDNGGVDYSELNAKTPRERCAKLRKELYGVTLANMSNCFVEVIT